MAKIYIPQNYVNNCNVFNDNYIRSYTNSSHTEWVDIYYKDSYALKSGFTNMSNPNVICDSLNSYSSDIYYRYDIDRILVIFLIILIVCFYFPYRLISRMFGRWLKW